MNESGRFLAAQGRPGLLSEDTFDLVQARERVKEAENETEPDLAAVRYQFQGRQMHCVNAHLAVADDAVAGY